MESQALRRLYHAFYDSLTLCDDFTINPTTVSGSATSLPRILRQCQVSERLYQDFLRVSRSATTTIINTWEHLKNYDFYGKKQVFPEARNYCFCLLRNMHWTPFGLATLVIWVVQQAAVGGLLRLAADLAEAHRIFGKEYVADPLFAGPLKKGVAQLSLATHE